MLDTLVVVKRLTKLTLWLLWWPFWWLAFILTAPLWLTIAYFEWVYNVYHRVEAFTLLYKCSKRSWDDIWKTW